MCLPLVVSDSAVALWAGAPGDHVGVLLEGGEQMRSPKDNPEEPHVLDAAVV